VRRELVRRSPTSRGHPVALRRPPARFDVATGWLNSAPLNAASLGLNQWALSGDWTIESGASVLNGTEGGIAFRFHARDAHLVLRAREPGARVPFRGLVDGEPPGDPHGLDVDGQGHGTVIGAHVALEVQTIAAHS
jgi:Thioredoxin like C-terminal domain